MGLEPSQTNPSPANLKEPTTAAFIITKDRRRRHNRTPKRERADVARLKAGEGIPFRLLDDDREAY
ncbi:hypothetical protein [Arthrobacter sp. MW3 TE3886]|uniref:hypothetical protein n=1 Tax=Arthrobacter sp. MW3 TE3886 TaxID=3156254 RepID=UPI003517E3AC